MTQVEIFEKYIECFLINNMYDELTNYFNFHLEFGKSVDHRRMIDNYPLYKILEDFRYFNNMHDLLSQFILRWVHRKYVNMSLFTSISKGQTLLDRIVSKK